MNVTYAIDPAVELDGVESLEDIAVNDEVGIEEAIRGWLESIDVEKRPQEEESISSETDEERPEDSAKETQGPPSTEILDPQVE